MLELRFGSKYVAMEYFGLKRMSVQCVSLHRTRNAEAEELNCEEFAIKLIFLMKILKLRNSVCPEENQSKDFEE